MIKLDWTLLVQLAVFLSFTAYLNAMLLRPMRSYLDRRRKTIEDLQAAGSGGELELERLQADYSGRIAAARDDMLAQRSAARKEMVDIQNSLIDEARKESHVEISRAEDDLMKEVRTARESLSREARELSSVIASKVLGRSLQ